MVSQIKWTREHTLSSDILVPDHVDTCTPAKQVYTRFVVVSAERPSTVAVRCRLSVRCVSAVPCRQQKSGSESNLLLRRA